MMIGDLFSWLGRQLLAFFSWLGHLLWVAFKAVLDAFGTFFDYLYDKILNFGSELVEFVLQMVPTSWAENADFQTVLAYIRSAWTTFDVFIPLSEGLVFVTVFFSFYFVTKLIQIIVRIILAVIP